jgi:hypothetical protein
MKQLLTIYLIYTVTNAACIQSKSQKYLKEEGTSQKTTLNFDTSKITIFDLKSDSWLGKRFESEKSFSLTDDDLKNIDEVFNKCIGQKKVDTSYFHYKRQYVPFIDKYGYKKV